MALSDSSALLSRYAIGVRRAAVWVLLGSMSGVLAGLSSYVFLTVLDRVTATRVDHGWLVFLLPVAGFALGLSYHRFGGTASQGKGLIIEQIHEPSDWVPRRMAPMVLVGTWITHLFGGSAGREGTALQLSAGLTDSVARHLPISSADRRVLLQASVAGGFGAVFGVPIAGTVFALEVPTVGRMNTEALVPALCASVVGNEVVHRLGYHHRLLPHLDIMVSAQTMIRVAFAGALFGLTGAAFAGLARVIRNSLEKVVAWPPLRPALGGLAVAGLSVLFGRSYLGLSFPLATSSLGGADIAIWVFALKLLFTAVTFGSGLPGGEVTPLFVIGATLGAALGPTLGVAPGSLAALGFVAVFAGASKTPLACTIMGLELFGTASAVPIALACVFAFVASGRTGIYRTQRWSEHLTA